MERKKHRINNLKINSVPERSSIQKEPIMEGELTGYPSIDKPWLKYYGEEFCKSIYEGTHTKMYSFMKDQNIKFLDDIALTYFGYQITYRELFENVDIMAKILKGYGINKGDFVSICMPNIPETVYLKYALNKIGAVANMIDPRHNANSILNYVNNSNSKLLFTVIDICDSKINTIIDLLRVDDVCVISLDASIKKVSNKDQMLLKTVYSYKKRAFKHNGSSSKYSLLDEFSKWGDKTFDIKEVCYEPDQIATVVYTSGTTGVSKGAVLTNEAYNVMHNQLVSHTNYERGGTFLGAIPFFTAYGSLCGMHDSLCSGQNLILMPKFMPKKVDKIIMKQKPNTAFLVPGFWETIINSNKSKNEDFSYLRMLIAGGDKMSPASLEKVNKFLSEHNCNHKLRIGYGASEFGGAIAVVPEDSFYTTNGSGMPLASCNVMIIDPDTGIELPYNSEGEICVSTKTMMREYLNNEEETNNLIIIKNGEKFYKTGDKGYIEPSGMLHVIDRYKRLMKVPDGHQVYSTIVENKIMEFPGVIQCCVVGLKYKDKSGVIPTAFVVLDEKLKSTDYDSLVSNIDMFCLKTLSERDKALAYKFVDELPYNLMGKVDYRKLEQKKLEDIDAIILSNIFISENKVKKLK